MQVKDITNHLERIAPRSLQESYDNSGLLVGDPHAEVKGITISLDVTEAVIDDAISHGSNLIIAHHPLVFKGLKSITGKHWVERCVTKAIKKDVAIYAIHTNLDNVDQGVNQRIADKLGLIDTKILAPKHHTLTKLVTFIPKKQANEVLSALYKAGAGEIGNYDHCSFQLEGKGTFRPGNTANPTIGSQNIDEEVLEVRAEVIMPNHSINQVLSALKKAHPYEEVAYYLTALDNQNQEVGSGKIGSLKAPMDTEQFLQYLKDTMQTDCIRHTQITQKKVTRIGVCGGAGSFLLKDAMRAGADVFITGDFKYHDFFEADDRLMIADIGHYESEQFTKDLLYDILSEKFTNIALRLTEVNTNPINYF